MEGVFGDGGLEDGLGMTRGGMGLSVDEREGWVGNGCATMREGVVYECLAGLMDVFFYFFIYKKSYIAKKSLTLQV